MLTARVLRGVLQGAGWSETKKVQLVHDAAPGPVAGGVAGADIPGLEQLAGEHGTGDVVIFSHRAGEARRGWSSPWWCQACSLMLGCEKSRICTCHFVSSSFEPKHPWCGLVCEPFA